MTRTQVDTHLTAFRVLEVAMRVRFKDSANQKLIRDQSHDIKKQLVTLSRERAS